MFISSRIEESSDFQLCSPLICNRLKEAQVRNNKLVHTLKLKEEKITSLEERFAK